MNKAEKTIREGELDILSQLLSPEQLIKKALAFKGLELEQGHPYYYSVPFAVYKLEGAFLEALEKGGFKFTKRPDSIITLSDENPQKCMPGFAPSNYWNFRDYRDRKKDELILKLQTKSTISYQERGVVLSPAVHGSFSSPVDELPSRRVFEVVGKYDAKAHPLVREIIAGNGITSIKWAKIGLGGIRRLQDLFSEFMSWKKDLESLARSSISPFNPNPYQQLHKIVDNRYLPESFQPALFRLWEDQLKEFKSKI